jgi:hypothetical protein
MKGQSLIVQYVTFFMIGFTLFLTIGNFFRYQANRSANEIVYGNLRLANSYLSSASITLTDSCKQCDVVTYKIILANRTTGSFFEIFLKNETGLKVSTPENMFASSIHKLNFTNMSFSGSGVSDRPIILTYNKNNNQLVVV